MDRPTTSGIVPRRLPAQPELLHLLQVPVQQEVALPPPRFPQHKVMFSEPFEVKLDILAREVVLAVVPEVVLEVVLEAVPEVVLEVIL